MMPVSDEARINNGSSSGSVATDYKSKYQNLKRKLKILLYENECYQDELKRSQRQFLQISRDKNFLLDRLLQYERVDTSTSDSDSTEQSSDSEHESSNKQNETPQPHSNKRKRPSESQQSAQQQFEQSSLTTNTPGTKKKKPNSTPNVSRGKNAAQSGKASAAANANNSNNRTTTTNVQITTSQPSSLVSALTSPVTLAPIITEEPPPPPILPKDGQLTSEELEKHFESRPVQSTLLLPEKTPLTLPVELFSDTSNSSALPL